jgi:hypothetical protein
VSIPGVTCKEDILEVREALDSMNGTGTKVFVCVCV